MDAAQQQKMMELFGEFQRQYVSLDVETKRNADNIDIFDAMIREAIPQVNMIAAGHHIMFTREGSGLPSEFASADTLIFNHEIALIVWGDRYKEVLASLAVEPVNTRDQLLQKLWMERNVRS